MIKIYHPRNFVEERIYILDIIFGEFLGLAYKFQEYEGVDYKIVLENNSSLVIRDSFFSYQKNDNYLTPENIPFKVKYIDNPFIVEKDIPIIYGINQLEVSTRHIICGIDIFASSFFMLTRWEEYVNKERDMHNRFPAVASLAFKNGFLDRPIVNEYVEMLWKMLIKLGIAQMRKNRKFEFIVTHDVDMIKYWKNIRGISKMLVGDLLKRRNITKFYENLSGYMQVKMGKLNDPYDTFDYIMDLSEQVNLKSRFYFMSGGVTNFDNDYKIREPLSINIIKKIKERGHIIGFHPSFNSYNNMLQWQFEKQRLEEVIGITVKEGRQHYLRFDIAVTWDIWDKNYMEMDSTLGYADHEGFRCGTCYEFSAFNFLKRKKLLTKEFPLIVMEGTFDTYQLVTPEYMERKIKLLLEKTMKYNGNFVFLWHNSSFNLQRWKPIQSIYEKILMTQLK